MSVYACIYILSCIFHVIGLYYAYKTMKEGEEYFVNSSPKNFFHSRIERKFWTVMLGGFANVCFLLVKPVYIIELSGNATGWQEPIWVCGHMAMGIATAVWHQMAFEHLKEIKGNDEYERTCG